MSSTSDREAVYEAVRQIPPGTVITYGDLAERVGRERNNALAVAMILSNRPDNEAWRTTPPEAHDIPWWRVVRNDGTMLDPAAIDDRSRPWIEWATAVLVAEGVAFTDDGRVASIAGRAPSSRASGSRSTGTRKVREPEPCWRHDKVQYSCRDCAPTQ